jgi:transcriptional regulator with XRE-family HTH domain
MIPLGQTARYVREKKGLTLRDAAEQLSISHAHLCNVENSKVSASLQLIEAMRKVYGVDVMIMTWLRHGDVNRLPPAVRKAAKALAEVWEDEIDYIIPGSARPDESSNAEH